MAPHREWSMRLRCQMLELMLRLSWLLTQQMSWLLPSHVLSAAKAAPGCVVQKSLAKTSDELRRTTKYCVQHKYDDAHICWN